MRRSIYGATLFLMFTLVAYGQSASNDSTQDHKGAIQNARHDLNQDVKDGDKAAAKQEMKDVRQDQRNLHQDVQKGKQDERGARQDVRDARQEQMKINQMRMAAAGGGRGGRR